MLFRLKFGLNDQNFELLNKLFNKNNQNVLEIWNGYTYPFSLLNQKQQYILNRMNIKMKTLWTSENWAGPDNEIVLV